MTWPDRYRTQAAAPALLVALAVLVSIAVAATGCRDQQASRSAPSDRPSAADPSATRTGDPDRTARSTDSARDSARDSSRHSSRHSMDEPSGHRHGAVPFADCPVTDDRALDPDALLDRASDSYTDGAFAIAYACADMATELVPNSVDAHHIRAAAASALGHHDIAQVTFALALALDPHDPETLAAAAEFYINVLPTRHRENTRVGLEYARRGRSRAVVRRRTGRGLRARLALLEAQAYNDLGRSEDALERVSEALLLAPDLVEATHEQGVALFNLCRFDQAEKAFSAVLDAAPDDPYAHHHLGLLHERSGREIASRRHFSRARELAPGEFWAPVMVPPEEFRAELTEAVSELPPELAERLHRVSLEVVDVPARDDLMAVDPPFSPTILGLFRGLPLGIEAPKGPGSEAIPTRTIVLYRKNLARAVKSRSELDEQIRRTLIHEIGHLSGLDEDDLRRRGLE